MSETGESIQIHEADNEAPAQPFNRYKAREGHRLKQQEERAAYFSAATAILKPVDDS